MQAVRLHPVCARFELRDKGVTSRQDCGVCGIAADPHCGVHLFAGGSPCKVLQGVGLRRGFLLLSGLKHGKVQKSVQKFEALVHFSDFADNPFGFLRGCRPSDGTAPNGAVVLAAG